MLNLTIKECNDILIKTEYGIGKSNSLIDLCMDFAFSA